MNLNLDGIRLDAGSHTSPEQGHCLLEVVSMFAGEPFTDQPQCVSPVLRDFGIELNDLFDADRRQELKRFIPRLPGTAADGLDEARGYLALDWLIRTHTPAWLDLAGLTMEAAELRGLRRIVDMAAAEAARPVVRNAQAKSAAARAAARAAALAAAAWDAALAAAARDAARAAAWDAAAGGAALAAAAWDAARAAARAAAGDAALAAAAWDAARAAARAAAGDAARAAARDALKPTVDALQESAIDLYDRMIQPAERTL